MNGKLDFGGPCQLQSASQTQQVFVVSMTSDGTCRWARNWEEVLPNLWPERVD